jgi:TRAP-type C4-dicarboxylate transport system permease small subunit
MPVNPDRAMLIRIHTYLSRVTERIDQMLIWLTSAVLVVIVTIGAMEIFSRYVLDRSQFFIFEVTVLLANYMYFFGFCLVAKRKGDIELEYFVKFLSERSRKILSYMTSILSFYFYYVLIYYGWKLLIIQSRHSSEGLNIPNHYFSLPLVIGAIVLTLIGVQRIMEIYLGTEKQ